MTSCRRAVLDVSGLDYRASGPVALPAQNLANVMRHTFAHDELLVVIECNQPAVAAQRGEFSDMVHVYQRIPMNPPETPALKFRLNHAEALRGQIALPRGDDPYQFRIRLKGKYLRGI